MVARPDGRPRSEAHRGRQGGTIVAGLRIPFHVEGNRLRYPFPLVDELTADGPDAYTGTAHVLGLPIGRFRMHRSH